MGNTLGLYLHIPFCRSKCDYCDFYSLAGQDDRMDDYQKALLRHITETAPRTKKQVVNSVYIGGGTPSYYGEKRLLELLSTVRKKFTLSKDVEITLEANPDSVDLKSLRRLRRAGVNRLSMGMQSACDCELVSVHRPHTFAQTEKAVQAARSARIKNLNLDLIYGLPGQTLESWKETLEKAAALSPEHLSCYGLKVEEGTPLWDMRAAAALPDDDLQADMYLWTVRRLEELGYQQYEISNFAKPEFASRHNLKYWTLGEYAGFGPGAHSDLGDVRYAYVKDLAAYCSGVEHQGDILSENERIPIRERDVEYIMLGLRITRGISRQEFEYKFRLPFGPVQAVLERFEKSGHVVLRGGRWHLTPEGFLISNCIIGQALEALAGEKLRREEAAANHDYRVR